MVWWPVEENGGAFYTFAIFFSLTTCAQMMLSSDWRQSKGKGIFRVAARLFTQHVHAREIQQPMRNTLSWKSERRQLVLCKGRCAVYIWYARWKNILVGSWGGRSKLDTISYGRILCKTCNSLSVYTFTQLHWPQWALVLVLTWWFFVSFKLW